MSPEDGGPPAEVYSRYMESGRLGFQRCAGCGAAIFYPRVLCPVCGSSNLAWETSSGRGVVYATTAVYRREDDPYNVVLVDVEVGAGVTLRLDPTDDGPVPVFVPEGEDP